MFYGGESFNIILGKATARLKYSDILLESLKKGKTERINISVENGEIIIAAEGVSKHGALPDGSLNAGYILAELLSSCEGLNENDRKLIRLRYFDGLTQSKTANILGVSQVQVSRREKVILSDMRKRLIG